MNYIRTIIEKLSRNKVIKRKFTVNGKSTPIWVSPDAQLKYLKIGSSVFDQDLINIAEKYLTINSNVWDIGANVGVFTFAASTIANKGSVISIEADIWLANIIRKTTMLKEYSNNNIVVLPVAISNDNSVDSFMISSRGRANNTLKLTNNILQMDGFREIQYVPTLTLDTLLKTFASPDFIKIDVEGAEYMVLQGAKHLINKIRPKFYIEVGTNVSSQIFKIFQAANYIAYDDKGIELIKSCAYNTFFIPKEHIKS